MGAGARVFCSRILMLQMLPICFRFDNDSLVKNLHADLNSITIMYNPPFPHYGNLCLASVRDGAGKSNFLLFANVSAHFQRPTPSEMK